MTASEFGNYLLFVAVLAGVLGVVNLLRPHKRWLGAGSVLLGLAAMLYRQGAAMPVIAVVCGLAVFCMATDIGTRQRSKT